MASFCSHLYNSPIKAPFWCGYAGGIGPENVVEQIGNIESVCNQAYWIDMERRVRADDDSYLNMAKVRRVLENVRRMANAEMDE